MSKISELSDGGSLVSSDYLIAVRSGGNVKVRMDQINVDQVDLGDNEFIRLGNSQDLTMVHTSTQSIINQAGIGDLLLQKAGATKLTINASGIAVTGSVTADNAHVPSSGSYEVGGTASGTTAIGSLSNSAGKLTLDTDSTRSIHLKTGGNLRQFIDGATGDISFYEDTGTTPKLVWDASAESLGIGNAIPIAALDVTGTDAVGTLTSLADTVTRAAAIIRGSTHANGYGLYMGYGNSSNDAQYIQSTLKTGSQAYPLLLNPYGGSILIGDSASHTDDLLQIETPASGGGHGIQIRRNDSNTDQGVGSITFGNNTATDLASISAKTDGATDNGALLFNTSVSGGANTERMRIDSSGHVKIGTTAIANSQTSALLSVRHAGPSIEFGHNNQAGYGSTIGANSSNGHPYVSFSAEPATTTANAFRTRGLKGTVLSGTATGDMTFSRVPLANADNQVPVESMRIDSSGNLLLNRSSAFTTAKMEIQSDAGDASTLALNSIDTDGNILSLYKAGNIVGSIGTLSSALTIGTGDVGVQFNADTNSIMPHNISTGANVDASIDIGYSSGGTNRRFKDLYLSSTVHAKSLRSIGATGVANEQIISGISGVSNGHLISQTTANELTYKWHTGANAQGMTFTNDGNLLVGITNIVAPNFQIQGPNAGTAGMNIGFVSMGNSNGGYPYIGYNCAPTTTSLSRYKYVNDYASWIDFHQGGVRTFTTTTGGIGNTSGIAGPYVAGGGTSWTSSSDRRLKDDVQAISYGLDAVKALKPVSYVRNDRDIESRELGFIAQDVEGIVDEVVNITDDGYYGLDYQRLIPVLTKAIQEQQATIEALTARIAALES